MKIKCIKISLNDEEKNIVGMPVTHNRDYYVSEDKEYTVIGMNYLTQCPTINGLSFYILNDFNLLGRVPIFLFEIVDPRPSAYWRAEIEEATFVLWPEEFYMHCFHDLFSDGKPEYVEAFKRAVARLENEFAYSIPGDEHVSANRFMFEIKQLIDDVKLNKWDYQKLSDIMADLIAKIKPEKNPLHTRVLDAWAVIFNQSLDTPSDKLSSEHMKVFEGILTKSQV
jgi:hypothetical protein